MNNVYENLLTPVKALNDLTVKTIEQIADLQVKTVQESAKASVNSLKSSSGVTDLDSLQTYLQNQLEAARKLSQSASSNAEKIAKIGESYLNEVKALVEKAAPAA